MKTGDKIIIITIAIMVVAVAFLYVGYDFEADRYNNFSADDFSMKLPKKC